MIEHVVTIGLRRGRTKALLFESLMDELSRLVETAGGTVEKSFTQSRPYPDSATYLGEGKIREIGAEIKQMGIKTVIFDDALTASQQKKIEKMIPAKVVDRTRLILDIFAQRARTKEGQLQVELAQLTYLVPRLTGSWRGYSQQSGGIGMRGPGERKIEVERRYVRERIKRLEKDIDEIRHHREHARENRQAVPIPQVALVGYTNVGKSTLLNTLVGKSDAVYADDKLFATLDPTTRRVKLPSGRPVLFTDTVGFIQNLPPLLMDAFHATLEEVTEAALLIHLVDASAPNVEDQVKTVLKVLEDLGAKKVPMLTVVNKIDRIPAAQRRTYQRVGAILISAKSGEGVTNFLEAVEAELDRSLLEVTFNLPHDKSRLLGEIYKTGHVIKKEAKENHTRLHVRMDAGNWARLSHLLKTKVEA